MVRVCWAALAVALLACEPPDKGSGTGTPPERFCPGATGCKKGSDKTLKIGVGSATVTPRAFEVPKPEVLERSGADCHEQAVVGTDNVKHCGKITPGHVTSCTKGVGCRGDFFFDCGRDQKCPGAPGYTGPDADGSEGDGVFQGFWLAGYGINLPMANVHDDLLARCVVLINGDVSLGLCSVDVVGLFRDDVERIRAAVAKKLPAPGLDYLLVSATHTHHGVDTEGQWGPSSNSIPEIRGVDDDWLTTVLIENTAQAAADAFTSARPAKLYAAQTRLGEKMNQLIRDSRDPYVIDDTLTVLKFTEKDGSTLIGTLVSWGNHPEALADTNNTLSADYPWALREGLEKGVFNKAGQQVRAGLGGTAIFLEGSVGGLMTSLGVTVPDVDGQPTPQRTLAKVKAVGDQLAISALDALAQAKELPAPPLAFGAQPLLLRVDNQIFQLAQQANLFKRRVYVSCANGTCAPFDDKKATTETNFPKVLSEVAKVQVGPLRFVAAPGELFPELAVGYDASYAFGNPQVKTTNVMPPNLAQAPQGPYLKQQLGGELPVVVGLANDHVGYLVPPWNFALHPSKPYLEEADGDHYEETNSLGPNTVPTLLEAYSSLLAWEPAP